MKKIIISLGTIVALGVMVVGGTAAFFGDTEVSAGNTFTAGAIDLKVDNESYYNGNVCAFWDSTNDGKDNPGWYWQGNAPYPVPGTPCTTSFELSDLDGLLFFDFRDLKPDDEGEDTISIHVGTNDAYVCMDLTLTRDDDNSSTEPELDAPDALENPGDAWDGELADALEFFWWADDGDNVYECVKEGTLDPEGGANPQCDPNAEGSERPLTNGVVSLTNLPNTFPIALADSENNVWDPLKPGPVPGNKTVYIAKAWCLGDLTLDAVPPGQGQNPSVDPGVNCDGTLLGNQYQTDGVELDIVFSAIQARHNPDFLCNPEELPLPILRVNKIITADTVGIGVEDFELHIDGPVPGPGDDQIVGDNVPVPGLAVGAYNVYENILPAGLPPGVTFTTTIGGACDSSGNVTLALGDNKVCTINNVENE